MGTLARRQTLKYLGILTATAAGKDFLTKWLPEVAFAGEPRRAHQHAAAVPTPGGAQAEKTAAYTPRFFEPAEFKAVEILTELIIPTDDTAGAKEAHVAQYVDFVVFSAAEFKPSLQTEWKQGLALLDRLSGEGHQAPFGELEAGAQQALLEAISLPERMPGTTHPGFGFYRLAKDMTVEGFYTSRVGLIEVLGYKGLSVLSEFPGCTHSEHQA